MVKKPHHIPSLVLGIIAIASLWFTCGISGLVCGIIGVNLANKNRQNYNSKIGFVLSLVALIISVLVLFVFAMFVIVLIKMPDSIMAYYIRDLAGAVLGKYGIDIG